MSRPFKSYSGKSAFGQLNEPLDGGEYILNKKAKYTYCSPNICHPNKNIGDITYFVNRKINITNKLKEMEIVNNKMREFDNNHNMKQNTQLRY